MGDDLDELWRAWHANPTKQARDAIVVAAQPNVRSSAANVRVPTWYDRSDLESVGQFGVFDAIRSFDPARGASFSTYANRRIRSRILDHIRGDDWAPRRVRREGRDLAVAEERAAQRHRRRPTDREVAAELGCNEHELLEMRRGQIGAELTSYSADPDHGGEPEAAIPDGADALFTVGDVRERVARALSHVTDERHRIVLALYFVDGLTLPEIGRVMGVSKSQVSKLRDQAMLRLRAGLEAG